MLWLVPPDVSLRWGAYRYGCSWHFAELCLKRILHVRQEMGETFFGKGIPGTPILWFAYSQGDSSVLCVRLVSPKKCTTQVHLEWIRYIWVSFICNNPDGSTIIVPPRLLHTFMCQDAIQRRLFALVSCRSGMTCSAGSASRLTSEFQEEFTWHPLKTCVPMLNRYRYACFVHPEHSLEGSQDPGPGMCVQVSCRHLANLCSLKNLYL